MNIPYTLTENSVTVVIDGVVTTVAAGSVNFNAIRAAIVAHLGGVEGALDAIPNILTQRSALADYLTGSGFYLVGDAIKFGADRLPEQFERRILAVAEKGESPIGLLNFYKRLQDNPSSRSVEQLWPFLDHEGIPIEKDGTFLAYKAVRADLLDCHSGTINNTPGNVIKIARNKISDDPNHACHFGLHVGAVGYAHSFGERIVIVRVDPADVVCIPYDASHQKMRVCSYEVVGFHVADGVEGNENPMPSTTYEVDVDDWDEEDSWPEEYDSIGKETTGTTVSVTETEYVKRNKKYAPAQRSSLDAMNAKALLGESIADLRTYASKVLKIVGASKLPGGKAKLVKRIIKVRK